MPKPNTIGLGSRSHFKTRCFQFKVIGRNECLAYETWRFFDAGGRFCKLKFTLNWNGDSVRIEGRVPVFALVTSTVLLVGMTRCIFSFPRHASPMVAFMVLCGVALVTAVLTLADQAGAARVMLDELADRWSSVENETNE